MAAKGKENKFAVRFVWRTNDYILSKRVDKKRRKIIIEAIQRDHKRSSRIILTKEALVLKEMRIKAGLSMRKAGALIGKSDSYIAHLETGRMDLPKGDKLDRILSIYGGIKQKSFFEKVRNFSDRPNDLTILRTLIDKANSEQLERITKFTEALLAGNL